MQNEEESWDRVRIYEGKMRGEYEKERCEYRKKKVFRNEMKIEKS